MLDCPTDMISMGVKAQDTFTTKMKFVPMFGPAKCAMWTEFNVMRPGVP